MATAQHTGFQSKAKFVLWCVLFLLVIIGALVSAVLTKAHFDEQQAGKAVAQALEEVRAMGMPVSTQDLSRIYPQVSPEDDIIRYVGETLGLLVSPPDDSRLPFVTDEPVILRGEQRNAVSQNDIAAFVATNGPALQKLPESWPRTARLPLGWEVIAMPPPTDLTQIRLLLEVLGVKALYCAESGDAPGASQAICHGLMVSSAMRDDWLSSLMTRTFGEAMMSEAAQATLSQVRLDEADLKVLMELFGNVRTNRFSSCLPVHYVNAIRVMEKLRRDFKRLPLGKKVLLTVMGTIKGKALLYSNADFHALLQQYKALTEICRLPLPDRLVQLRALDKQEVWKHRGFAFLLAAGSLEWEGQFRMDEVVNVEVLLSQIALALEFYRHLHGGQPPDALSALVPDVLPEIPKDPFDGRPIRYRKEEVGYLIYSVGADGVDDSGREESQHGLQSDSADIVFRVTR